MNDVWNGNFGGRYFHFRCQLGRTVTQKISERDHEPRNGRFKVIIYRLDMKFGVFEHTQFIHKFWFKWSSFRKRTSKKWLNIMTRFKYEIIIIFQHDGSILSTVSSSNPIMKKYFGRTVVIEIEIAICMPQSLRRKFKTNCIQHMYSGQIYSCTLVKIISIRIISTQIVDILDSKKLRTSWCITRDG